MALVPVADNKELVALQSTRNPYQPLSLLEKLELDYARQLQPPVGNFNVVRQCAEDKSALRWASSLRAGPPPYMRDRPAPGVLRSDDTQRPATVHKSPPWRATSRHAPSPSLAPPRASPAKQAAQAALEQLMTGRLEAGAARRDHRRAVEEETEEEEQEQGAAAAGRYDWFTRGSPTATALRRQRRSRSPNKDKGGARQPRASSSSPHEHSTAALRQRLFVLEGGRAGREWLQHTAHGRCPVSPPQTRSRTPPPPLSYGGGVASSPWYRPQFGREKSMAATSSTPPVPATQDHAAAGGTSMDSRYGLGLGTGLQYDAHWTDSGPLDVRLAVAQDRLRAIRRHSDLLSRAY